MPEAGDQLCPAAACSAPSFSFPGSSDDCSMFHRQYVCPSDHALHHLVKLFLAHWVEPVGVSKLLKLGHNAVMFKFHTWELHNQLIFKNCQKKSNFFKFILTYSLKECSQQCWGSCDSRSLRKWLVALQLQSGSRERGKMNECMCPTDFVLLIQHRTPTYGMVTPTFRVGFFFWISVHLI